MSAWPVLRIFNSKGPTKRAVAHAKIALVANTGWFLYNYRLALMKALANAGHEVLAVAPEDAYTSRIVEAGFRHLNISLSRTGTNPIDELRSVLSLRRVLRSQKVDTVLSFTPKGNIFASLGSLDLRLRQIVTVSGMGRLFNEASGLRVVVSLLYKLTALRASHVLFENMDDLKYFTDRGWLTEGRYERIPGLGIDLKKFAPAQENECSKIDGLTFLFVGRLQRTKGLEQFVDAARIVRARHGSARFRILGPLEPDDAMAVSAHTLKTWTNEHSIEYLGVADDVRPHVAAADCIVLPSYYREGLPRSLMEAAAMAKPIITSDIIGCRDAIDDGVTGLLCKPRDVADLVATVERFIALSPAERCEMGRRGRKKMETQFDESIVIGRYLDLVAEIGP